MDNGEISTQRQGITHLSGVRKAAVVLMVVGEGFAKEVLRCLPELDVECLTSEFADLWGISFEVFVVVMEEF